MARQYVISYDVGTSGVKVVFFSLEGAVLSSTTESYPLFTNEHNHAEQDPESFWQASCRATKAILGQGGFHPGDCAGMAFGTQWKAIIPIDGKGNVLRRAIIWMDKRAGRQAERLNQAFGRPLFCESDYWPKLAWFRENEPELYSKSAQILEVGGYMKWRATGVLATDITNCYTRSYSPEKQVFYDEILRQAGLDPDKFPPICRATDRVGNLTDRAAAELGLKSGIPVFGGCCDIPALAIGSGCCVQGDAHAYLGTSGWLGYIAPQDPGVVYSSPLDEENDVSFYGLGAPVGASTSWVVAQLYGQERQALGDGVWDRIGEDLARVPPGSDRLLAAPWFYGGRPPHSSGLARGVFVNVGGSHTKAHMVSAVLEGFCYIMRQNLALLNQKLEKPLSSLTVCGGGSKNPHWMQAMASILGIPVSIPRDSDCTGAVGVAYCALIGLGIADGYANVKNHIKIGRVFQPDPTTFSQYDLLYGQFQKLYKTLTGLFEALNRP